MRRAATSTIGLLSAGLALAMTPPAAAQVSSAGAVGESASLTFVPPFHGAVTVDLGFDARFDSVFGDISALEATAPSLGLGYLHYLDGHGRTALGGALRFSRSAAVGQDLPRQSGFTALDLRLEARWRFINVHFAHLTLAPFVDLGLVWPEVPIEPGGDGPFPRAVVGIGLGPGGLLHADPYVFAELVSHIGVSVTPVDGVAERAIVGGVRLRFDFGLRGRDLLPCEYAPMEYGPCP
ncbi:MAG: hypothetical protein R3F65_24480 [bacterium]